MNSNLAPYYDETPPQYRPSSRKYRKVYFGRIAAVIIVLCLIAAGCIWFFSPATKKTISFNSYTLYFSGEASITEFVSYENPVFESSGTGVTILDAELYSAAYFKIEHFFLSKTNAENSALESAKQGLRRAVLRVDLSGAQMQANSDEDINIKASGYFDKCYQNLENLHSLSEDIANKSISQELFDKKISVLKEENKAVLDELLKEKAVFPPVFTYFYSSLNENLDILSKMDIKSVSRFLGGLELKTAYNFYIVKSIV